SYPSPRSLPAALPICGSNRAKLLARPVSGVFLPVPRLAGGGAGRSRTSGARHDAAILGEALSQQGPAAERRADVLFLAGGQGLGAGAADGRSVATGPSSSPAAARGFLTAARRARGTH